MTVCVSDMLDSADKQNTIKKFKALGNSLRLDIYSLVDGHTVNEVTAILCKSQSQISQEIRILEEANLIMKVREAGCTRIFRKENN